MVSGLTLVLLMSSFCSLVSSLGAAQGRPQLDMLAGVSLPTTDVSVAIQAIDFLSTIQRQRKNQEQLMLAYSIFKGRSALRDIDDRATLSFLQLNTQEPDMSSSSLSMRSRFRLVAVIVLSLLGRNQSDAAHEVVLGVNLVNLQDAEYAATHPGETSWSKDHPLSECEDMLHSVIHRLCEGSARGEGGYTGWQNADYWAAGGPKRRYDSETMTTNWQHAVRTALAQAATKYAPLCVEAGVVVSCSRKEEPRRHRIIADGGQERIVTVPVGCWDPFCFIDLIRQNSRPSSTACTTMEEKQSLQNELDWLQELELRLLVRHEVLQFEKHSAEDGHHNGEKDDSSLVQSLLAWKPF
jgi:hypothetical protein